MTISYDDFAKLELRVGKIVSAAKLEGSDRLLKVEVDVGEKDEAGNAKKRELAAGIARDYLPEELVGKSVIVLANIEPKNVRGLLSNGMMLAAVDEAGKAILLTTDRQAPVGAKIL